MVHNSSIFYDQLIKLGTLTDQHILSPTVTTCTQKYWKCVLEQSISNKE